MSKSILIVCTSAVSFGESHQTGIWLEEFAVPYNRFLEAGYRVTVASINGGNVSFDPQSAPSEEQNNLWQAALYALQESYAIADIAYSEIDALFLPGGHGTMFDFPQNKKLQEIISHCAENNKIIASVCHGPAALVHIELSDGTPFVSGKRVTCFTDEEEHSINLEKEMPFLLESALRDKGALFESGDAWTDTIVVDGTLLTGQNPMSSDSLAQALIKTLN